jgi:hypothetical protein
MDDDLDGLTREDALQEIRRLRAGIREHRDSTGQELCWHHPKLWGLLPEKLDPAIAVPPWPQFLHGCLLYRESLDRQAPNAPAHPEDPAARPAAIVPFVPSGKDYARSRAFFAALGFKEEWEGGGYAGFAWGGARFMLQDLDRPDVASQMMIRVDVPDLDAWWAGIVDKKVAQAFPDARFKEPTTFPWAREVHFVDPAGVCWHVGAD